MTTTGFPKGLNAGENIVTVFPQIGSFVWWFYGRQWYDILSSRQCYRAAGNTARRCTFREQWTCRLSSSSQGREKALPVPPPTSIDIRYPLFLLLLCRVFSGFLLPSTHSPTAKCVRSVRDSRAVSTTGHRQQAQFTSAVPGDRRRRHVWCRRVIEVKNL